MIFCTCFRCSPWSRYSSVIRSRCISQSLTCAQSRWRRLLLPPPPPLWSPGPLAGPSVGVMRRGDMLLLLLLLLGASLWSLGYWSGT